MGENDRRRRREGGAAEREEEARIPDAFINRKRRDEIPVSRFVFILPNVRLAQAELVQVYVLFIY